jgi:integration host factor subunit alpha
MTKPDLVERVFVSLGVSRAEAAPPPFVELALEIIKETLETGENVKISGFCSFVVRQKKARRGRNPRTGERMEITPRKVVTFKPSQMLKEAINAGT